MQDQIQFIDKILLTGPADHIQLLEHIHNAEESDHGAAWLYVLEASRSSQYATTWREIFGRKHDAPAEPKSILELAIENLADGVSQSFQDEKHAAAVSVFARIIANCCADNDYNRRLTIHAGGIGILMKALSEGNDLNVLVPAIYNVCADIQDPAEHIRPQTSTPGEPINVTVAEERLATLDFASNNILSGLSTLLTSSIVQSAHGDTKEYLAELLELASKPVLALGPGSVEDGDPVLGRILARLHSSDAGVLLADYSVRCRISVSRIVLILLTLPAAKAMLATTGSIFYLGLMADEGTQPNDYYGEDEDEQKDNATTLQSLCKAILKIIYETCQMPQFTSPPKYGIARQSINFLYNQDPSNLRPYRHAIAFAMLYGFVDCDARANLLVTENANFLGGVLFWIRSNVKEVVYPALALATKLAVTWNLKQRFYEADAVMAVDHLLRDTNFGYDIPLTAVTFLELLMKSQPEHIRAMLLKSSETGRSVLQNIFTLFERGNEPICFEIGRLMIEIISTLAQSSLNEQRDKGISLDEFLVACNHECLAKILVWMGTKGLELDLVNAQRVWFALGLLSLTEQGKNITYLAIQDQDFSSRVQQEMSSLEDTPAKRNISYMIYRINGTTNLTNSNIAPDDLNDAVARMSIAENVDGAS